MVAKTLNDPFQDTPLSEILGNLGTERLLITGWATDFCVDATVRRAVALGITADAIRTQFHFIQNDWKTGDVTTS